MVVATLTLATSISAAAAAAASAVASFSASAAAAATDVKIPLMSVGYRPLPPALLGVSSFYAHGFKIKRIYERARIAGSLGQRTSL